MTDTSPGAPRYDFIPPVRWRITKERIRVRPLFPGENFRPYWSFKAWSVYYGSTRVARYRDWARACDHVATAHRRFGI